MVEYALILVLVAIIVVVALSALGAQISHVFESITGKLQTT
ncbi:MAG: Flp family type IVb pilin [Candidatus Dormibacteraeota bacterium]|jgi:Flp pilus assembly pilin Flp|nr:Flp family type IVb pilin [Candidatus Dormibacteraeota bacterium]MBO0704679.1 Flp family type IVb pilin [Candidatus Dormibacteraeota bacterium]MBO0762660.1 Flp family type IVb pilin [Candidatus Dormibacteraeota bacterium]